MNIEHIRYIIKQDRNKDITAYNTDIDLEVYTKTYVLNAIISLIDTSYSISNLGENKLISQIQIKKDNNIIFSYNFPEEKASENIWFLGGMIIDNKYNIYQKLGFINNNIMNLMEDYQLSQICSSKEEEKRIIQTCQERNFSLDKIKTINYNNKHIKVYEVEITNNENIKLKICEVC